MNGENTAFTLKEILLGISDSLNEAQQQLRNAKPYDEYGRPNTLYTLPYLDFNLQVEAEFENAVETSTSYQEEHQSKRIPYRNGMFGSLISYRPVNKKTNTKDTSKVTSTISGRFVAVMPNEGLPQLILEATPKHISNSKYEIEVKAFNAAGETVPNALVEFNYDKEKTEMLNTMSLNHNTNFISQGEVLTNADGIAVNEIVIDSTDYNNSALIQIEINIGTVNTKISIQKQ